MKRLVLAICLACLVAPSASAAGRDFESSLQSIGAQAVEWFDQWWSSTIDSLVVGTQVSAHSNRDESGQDQPEQDTRGDDRHQGPAGGETENNDGSGDGPGEDTPLPSLGPVLVPSG